MARERRIILRMILFPLFGLLALVLVLAILWWRANRVPLTQRLGLPANAKVLIVNADDCGLCHSTNQAVFDGMRDGMITTATVMVPAPGFEEVAEYAKANPECDFGVHLTHTSEWKTYRWGPILPPRQVPNLIDPDGFLWRSVTGENGVYTHSNPDEAYREAVAQIDAALAAGIDVTHIDSHMGTMQYDLRYALKYIRLALKYDLPLRMASQDLLREHNAAWLRPALRTLGLVFPDYLILTDGEHGETAREHWHYVLRSLQPGVTEIYIHPAYAGAEMRGITNSWKWRAAEFETFYQDAETRRLLEEENIILLGYRELRDLQRK